MDKIQFLNKDYPIRFDFRALKEFKTITGNDVLKTFDSSDTDNIITLAFTALKSGHFLQNPTSPEFPLTIEHVSSLISLRDMKKIVDAFTEEVSEMIKDQQGATGEAPGEILGTASIKQPLEG